MAAVDDHGRPCPDHRRNVVDAAVGAAVVVEGFRFHVQVRVACGGPGDIVAAAASRGEGRPRGRVDRVPHVAARGVVFHCAVGVGHADHARSEFLSDVLVADGDAVVAGEPQHFTQPRELCCVPASRC